MNMEGDIQLGAWPDRGAGVMEWLQAVCQYLIGYDTSSFLGSMTYMLLF